jgi:methylmalonyl-CoA mutase N-terminal domain/subunit
VSISGYHIREAGSTACRSWPSPWPTASARAAGIERGLDVDDFAPRLSFFFDIHNDFFEEIAKLRAARRIGHRDATGSGGAGVLRAAHAYQTAGVSPPPAAAQQRGAGGAAGPGRVLGGSSLHTNSYDEVLACPPRKR